MLITLFIDDFNSKHEYHNKRRKLVKDGFVVVQFNKKNVVLEGQEKINYYVIHCAKHSERIQNIETNLKSIVCNLKIWNGTYVVKAENPFELFKQHDNNIFYNVDDFPIKSGGQIGCYLSHHLLLKHCMENSRKSGFTVILEDDIKISNDFCEKINYVIENNSAFDIAFLGLLFKHGNKRGLVDSKTLDLSLNGEGTHGLLIRNSSLEKIYKLNCFPKGPIDSHYNKCVMEGKLNSCVLFPYLCFQQRDIFVSSILECEKNKSKKFKSKNTNIVSGGLQNKSVDCMLHDISKVLKKSKINVSKCENTKNIKRNNNKKKVNGTK